VGIAPRLPCEILARYSTHNLSPVPVSSFAFAFGENAKDRKSAILKEFLEEHAVEVLSMLTAELKLEDVLEDVADAAREEGREEEREEIARNALAKGMPLELIHEITGLDMETIKSLQAPNK
jgi:dynactin complex subunit